MSSTPTILMVSLCFIWLSALAKAEDVPTPVLTLLELDPQHQELAKQLSAIVHRDGINYSRLQRDHLALDRYRRQLADTTIPHDKSSQMALYINAYNAWTLALVSMTLPEDSSLWTTWSIKDADKAKQNPWEKYTFELAKKRYTLDQLENSLLRPLRDPRIHFAINCASRSCPTLDETPFVSENINERLEACSVSFATNAYHIRSDQKMLMVNPILQWFAEDFNAYGGVIGFLQPRVLPEIKPRLAAQKALTYFDYDWSLNLSQMK